MLQIDTFKGKLIGWRQMNCKKWLYSHCLFERLVSIWTPLLKCSVLRSYDYGRSILYLNFWAAAVHGLGNLLFSRDNAWEMSFDRKRYWNVSHRLFFFNVQETYKVFFCNILNFQKFLIMILRFLSYCMTGFLLFS